MKSVPCDAPPRPTKFMNCSTRGSARTISPAASWSRRIASKEVPSAPWVKAKIEPVSSLGRKPFGMRPKSQTVPAITSASTPIARRRRARKKSRLRA